MQFKSKFVALASAVALSVGGSAHATDAVQWRVADGGNGHWYAGAMPTGVAISWSFARDECLLQGGYLACISSAAENGFVAQVVASPDLWTIDIPYCIGPWLGGFQPPDAVEPAGGWSWVSGDAWGFQNWWLPAQEPNDGCGGEDYLHFLTQGATTPSDWWNDGGGQLCPPGPKSFVAEWSADCNNDGIVDYGQIKRGELPDYNGNNIPDCCEQGSACVVGSYPVQWRVADGGNGHWYQGVGTASGIGWASAQVACVSAGGSLVSIGIAAESSWLYETIAWRVNLWSNSGPFIVGPWIGARGASGNWRWDDGTPWNYSAWSPGEGPPSGDPREQFAHFFNGVGPVVPNNSWGDYFDEPFNHSYIIEWSADCNNDGIIDYGQILSGALSDFNSDGVPDACQCDADIDSNSEVDGIDLAIILDTWGTNGGKLYPAADINHSGLVDGADLAQVLNSWGPCP